MTRLQSIVLPALLLCAAALQHADAQVVVRPQAIDVDATLERIRLTYGPTMATYFDWKIEGFAGRESRLTPERIHYGLAVRRPLPDRPDSPLLVRIDGGSELNLAYDGKTILYRTAFSRRFERIDDVAPAQFFKTLQTRSDIRQFLWRIPHLELAISGDPDRTIFRGMDRPSIVASLEPNTGCIVLKFRQNLDGSVSNSAVWVEQATGQIRYISRTIGDRTQVMINAPQRRSDPIARINGPVPDNLFQIETAVAEAPAGPIANIGPIDATTNPLTVQTAQEEDDPVQLGQPGWLARHPLLDQPLTEPHLRLRIALPENLEITLEHILGSNRLTLLVFWDPDQPGSTDQIESAARIASEHRSVAVVAVNTARHVPAQLLQMARFAPAGVHFIMDSANPENRLDSGHFKVLAPTTLLIGPAAAGSTRLTILAAYHRYGEASHDEISQKVAALLAR